MTTLQYEVISLSGLLCDSGSDPCGFVQDPKVWVEWSSLHRGSVLHGRGNDLFGQSVLLSVRPANSPAVCGVGGAGRRRAAYHTLST